MLRQVEHIRVYYVLDQHVRVFFFNRASSIKQESIGKHIYPFGHISPPPNQPLCAFTLLFGVPGREAANTRLCCYVFHPLHRGECAMLTRRYNGYD